MTNLYEVQEIHRKGPGGALQSLAPSGADSARLSCTVTYYIVEGGGTLCTAIFSAIQQSNDVESSSIVKTPNKIVFEREKKSQ